MSEVNPIGQLAVYYTEQPVVQALAQFLPMGGSLDTLLKARAQEIAEDRAKVFFDELATTLPELTPELIQSEEFVHRFVITAKAAANTRRQEKIRLFAQLFGGSVRDESHVDTDEYEEYLSILDELSYREIVVLNTLERYESRYPLEDGDEMKRCSKFWGEFLSKIASLLQVSENEVKALLTRLNRTGCYSTITGTYFDYEGDKGYLTPLYFKLKRLLKDVENY